MYLCITGWKPVSINNSCHYSHDEVIIKIFSDVFRVVRPYGTFFAILGTYVVSAMLHGLNLQLAAVLLSLGFYTYTEHVTRKKLSSIFSACIQARKCNPNCGHQLNESHWLPRVFNIGFSLLAMFHLAYLGLMFDSSKMQDEGYSLFHALAKWRWLNYSSHWIVLSTLFFYYLIWSDLTMGFVQPQTFRPNKWKETISTPTLNKNLFNFHLRRPLLVWGIYSTK